MKILLPDHSTMRTKEFLYGVATASFQVEGGSDTRQPCIWDTFCATPNKIADGSDGHQACEHIKRWEEDVELIESLGVDAYRLSISWPRVMQQDGSLNQSGVDFYIALLDRLIEKGIKPFVTLYHWDLPQHLEDQGGWLNRETAYHFRDYADLITKAFGDRVHSYATLNEPFCSSFLGYEIGIHAPGITGKQKGRQAAHHLLLAHGLAMPVIQKNSPNSLNGIVLNFTPAYPESNSAADQKAADIANDYFNQWYIKPLFDAAYPDLLNQLPEADQPIIEDGDLQIIAAPLDFLGVNFYTRAIYRAPAQNEQSHYDFVEVQLPNVARTDIGWEIYPQAFTGLLVDLNKRYNLPPVYITENGAAFDDSIDKDDPTNDIARIEYYNDHLNAVHNAIEQGVDIKGYFAWSLMDNFEWAEGYLKRFGIVHVDYVSQKRTIKASGNAYQQLITNR